MKLFVGFLTLALALIISGVAAYFSVVGLAAIFAATFIPVVIMGVSLEAGKLVAAAWLHENWSNPRVNFLHKAYMTTAVIVLMIITSMGVFGFLAKGHTEQAASQAPVMLQIAQKEQRLEQLTREVESLNGRQTQLDAAVNSIIANNATGGLRARRQQTSERSEITRGVEAANAEINAINSELVPLKLEVSAAETKVGPIKFIAGAVGIKDTEKVVLMFILLLVVVFDPLAVILVLSGVMTISAALEDRRKRKTSMAPSRPIVSEPELLVEDEPETACTEPELVIVEDETLEEKKAKAEAAYLAVLLEESFSASETVTDRVRQAHKEFVDSHNALEAEEDGNLMLELEQQLPQKNDEAVLLDILERRPELLRNVIDAVQEQSETNTATSPDRVDTTGGWVDNLNLPPR